MEDAWPYPLHDRPLELGGDRRVQLYNIIAVSAGGPPSFGIQYASALPSNDGDGRRLEAEAVIRYFAPMMEGKKALSASAQICATRAQAETREPPEQIFTFERGTDGTWVCTGEMTWPPRPSA